MPKTCCVPGCRSGYRGTSEKVSLFCLPSDAEKREQWKCAIPRQEAGGFSFDSQHVRVCEKHFDTADVVWNDTFLVKGDVVSLRREKPKLRPDAVPRRFDGLPAYLSKVTAANILPTRLMSLAAEMVRLGIRLPSIRLLGVGGDALYEAAYSTILSAFDGVECLVNRYAITEAMGVVCLSSTRGALAKDIGFPVPTAQVKVVDEKTRQRLDANQTGEICFRTPTMMKEYYKKPKETAEFFDEEGWGKSGDAGYYDEDGRLHLVQRLKQLIKCLDKAVAPAELENLLLQEHVQDICEVAVVGLRHPQYGEAPAAAVVLRGHHGERDSGSLAELADRMKSTIEGWCPALPHVLSPELNLDS
ncbi:hypothetical protein HPB48_001584 [Haemaphysalis longicornis]|uniref:THAP-type domain-containing protein n=1 Tax=Haemaphysalis longicornis TaxID=44386 RepID=A0A9J6GAE1_HAELO|nr:hypothetical protein HPB48_001584 [Haemaphysalis longicornis]